MESHEKWSRTRVTRADVNAYPSSILWHPCCTQTHPTATADNKAGKKKNFCFFMFFFPSGFRGTAGSAHETHTQQLQLTQLSSTNDSVGGLPVDHHLRVLLKRP